ncbi:MULTISPECIES: HAD family hydrolase [Rossellomorea]|uniref:HAD-IIB family hydrolase n=1 Tax=Rossellomorea TaxID=2837508 RepID=UPI001CCAB491|nr:MULTISPECIES: HAD family hydrolase [Rossellomorea]MCA0148410.1 Cof-type HAD-IIB family hydrolase [Rossellomorea vietnamensis]WGG47778.1 HAD family hydrolase [Rossellomorea sp. DA94]
MKFVFDLDGTICFKGKPISTRIVQCLLELKSDGHEVLFASARPIRDMLPVLDARFHSFPLIGGNGSLLYHKGEVIHSTSFHEKDLKKIYGLIEQYKSTYLIDSEWDYAYTGPLDHPILNFLDPDNLAQRHPVASLNSIVKILLLSASNFQELIDELQDLDIVVNIHTNENVVDISPFNIHKWSALSEFGVDEGDFIAFGNDANDINMFQKAKHAVMIGYHEGLSSFADEQIPLTGDYEEEIIRKLKELTLVYNDITIGTK